MLLDMHTHTPKEQETHDKENCVDTDILGENGAN